MTPDIERILAVFAGITILVDLVANVIQLRNRANDQQKATRAERISLYRVKLDTIREATSLILDLTFIVTLQSPVQDLSTLVSIYAKAIARIHTTGASIDDTALNFAIADFLRTVDEYKRITNSEPINSERRAIAGGELQLSYMGVLMRCNELSDNPILR